LSEHSLLVSDVWDVLDKILCRTTIGINKMTETVFMIHYLGEQHQELLADIQ